jgi:hypothetical protein
MSIKVFGIEVTSRFRKVKYDYVSKIPMSLAEDCYAKALSKLSLNSYLDKGFYIEVSSGVSNLGILKRVLTLYRYVQDKNCESIQYVMSVRMTPTEACLVVSGSAYGYFESLVESDESEKKDKSLLFS